ncbi:unnamed protein product [Adineta steineri]|uniref:Uncharacterized protein n=1 Tax=Adineta steineri TaxID=433720 RepID=A0A815Q7R9_9BILA|nr:unnamed protein product [Adineta steineri]CAF1632548.1 unnamed protein product [Adineta steineri]
MSKLKTGVIPDIDDDDTEDEDDEEGEDDKEGEDDTKDEDSTEDENDQEDEIVKMKITLSKKEKDQGTILMWLAEIDERFLKCKPVENLRIKFDGEHAESDSAQP